MRCSENRTSIADRLQVRTILLSPDSSISNRTATVPGCRFDDFVQRLGEAAQWYSPNELAALHEQVEKPARILLAVWDPQQAKKRAEALAAQGRTQMRVNL